MKTGANSTNNNRDFDDMSILGNGRVEEEKTKAERKERNEFFIFRVDQEDEDEEHHRDELHHKHS